ncbi:MAG: multiheme c-type cytochrome [Betaproteobacteria bacterium]
MRHVLRLALAAAMVWMVAPGTAAARQAKTDDYAWAAACKECHAAEYAAWDRTKHAHAINRLSGSEKDADGKCISCHVTGAPSLLADDVNANIQCEACHGAGKAHIAAAAGGAAKPGAIVAVPAESVCVQCHSEKSPHFKFFSYAAMAGLVHQVPK